jgi:hypothetical protein
LTEIGDTIVGALASDPNHSKRQMTKFGDRDVLLFKPDGKPQLEEILHLVAMPGTVATVGSEDDVRPVESFDHVRWSVSGFKWGQVIEQRRGLPAAFGFRAGQSCSSDVYTISLIGWSAETENPQRAEQAGFVVEKANGKSRVILRSQEDKDRYVIAQSRAGGNTNPAKDYAISIRRHAPEERAWAQAADDLFLSKPWLRREAPPEVESVNSEDLDPF